MGLNKDNISKWITALRSGDYEQGCGCLVASSNGDNRYCCLGVACKLYQNEIGGLVEKSKLSLSQDATLTSFNADCNYLPNIVSEWFGFDSVDPRVEYRGFIESLSQLNDKGKTFTEIADLIEQEYLTNAVA